MTVVPCIRALDSGFPPAASRGRNSTNSLPNAIVRFGTSTNGSALGSIITPGGGTALLASTRYGLVVGVAGPALIAGEMLALVTGSIAVSDGPGGIGPRSITVNDFSGPDPVRSIAPRCQFVRLM